MALTALQRGDDRTSALIEVVRCSCLISPKHATRTAGLASGLHVHYDLGEGHPLLGRRIPDLDLVTANGPLRASGTCCTMPGRCFGPLVSPASSTSLPGADRVQLIDADKNAGTWELPALGAVIASAAALVRPDGYVAWV